MHDISLLTTFQWSYIVSSKYIYIFFLSLKPLCFTDTLKVAVSRQHTQKTHNCSILDRSIPLYLNHWKRKQDSALLCCLWFSHSSFPQRIRGMGYSLQHGYTSATDRHKQKPAAFNWRRNIQFFFSNFSISLRELFLWFKMPHYIFFDIFITIPGEIHLSLLLFHYFS